MPVGFMSFVIMTFVQSSRNDFIVVVVAQRIHGCCDG